MVAVEAAENVCQERFVEDRIGDRLTAGDIALVVAYHEASPAAARGSVAMGHALFFLFAVAAGLLWTAACTAAATRVRRSGLRALLLAIGAGLPVIALVPIVALTWWLAFGMRIQSNWFPHTLTVLLALVIGGAWIVRAGLGPHDGGSPPATRWPLIGLVALCLIAAAVTAGTLLVLDNAVAAQAPYLRLEAAQLIQSNLPPIVAVDANAAPLHLEAGAVMASDKEFSAEDSLLDREGDVMREAVTVFLARHAATLDLVRRAADCDDCRFARDWSRPSIDMLLPEIQALRAEARLLALAARRAAAEGRHADALADIVRIQRLGRHAAAEPILISYLVGVAIERNALAELVDLLPRLGAADAPLLDSPDVRDLVGRPFDFLPALRGEEAFGLAMFADFADGRMSSADVYAVEQGREISTLCDIGPFFRVFSLPSDIEGYRRLMHAFQQLVARRAEPLKYVGEWAEAEALEQKIRDAPPGILSRWLFPSLGNVLQARARDEAARRAAALLVSATKQRLATGTLPLEPDEFVGTPPVAVPGDPFAAGPPLVVKRGDAGLSVYSVGPDGEDDGGPIPPGDEGVAGNDDVGFVMAIH